MITRMSRLGRAEAEIPMMREWLRRASWDVPPDSHLTASSMRRRRRVTLVILVLGTLALGGSLRIEPGNVWFYPAAFGMSVIWAVGALVSGPLHLGRITQRDELRRPIASPIVIGLALAAVFVAGALIIRHIPVLDRQVSSVMEFADEGSPAVLVIVTALGGVAEELFFRGALYASVERHPIAVTTVAYGLATLATGNVMLTFAAVVLASVVGLERRASGGILAPALTHVTWSLCMLLVLPLLIG
jgi:membrane protease YdiL (CAAX protease family)